MKKEKDKSGLIEMDFMGVALIAQIRTTKEELGIIKNNVEMLTSVLDNIEAEIDSIMRTSLRKRGMLNEH